MPEILDDKSEHCTNFILTCLEKRSAGVQEVPLFVGLNGAQGSGKTTLVCIASIEVVISHISLSSALRTLYRAPEHFTCLVKRLSSLSFCFNHFSVSALVSHS